MVADALVTVGKAGATGLRVLRADSAFYTYQVIAAAGRHHARFSITARQDPAVRKAIAGIDPDGWTTINYPNAIFDEDQQRWISDAEVAEVAYTAFTSRRRDQQVSARLIVRRVPDLNPANQSELFTVYRYHAVFTNSPQPMLEAESAHRAHAIVEQVIADLKNGPLAHLPSGGFWANSAWLVCAAIAFNLTRAAGTLASAFHAKATTATIRAQLINVPARLARRLTMPPAEFVAMGESLATTLRRLRARPTTDGLTHPSVQQDPTRDHPRRSAGSPGDLGMHHDLNQPGRADQASTKPRRWIRVKWQDAKSPGGRDRPDRLAESAPAPPGGGARSPPSVSAARVKPGRLLLCRPAPCAFSHERAR